MALANLESEVFVTFDGQVRATTYYFYAKDFMKCSFINFFLLEYHYTTTA